MSDEALVERVWNACAMLVTDGIGYLSCLRGAVGIFGMSAFRMERYWVR